MQDTMTPEVQCLLGALRSAVERSRQSHSRIEKALDMRCGALEAVFSGRVDLSVSHLFGILGVIGLDLWDVLMDVEPPGVDKEAKHYAA